MPPPARFDAEDGDALLILTRKGFDPQTLQGADGLLGALQARAGRAMGGGRCPRECWHATRVMARVQTLMGTRVQGYTGSFTRAHRLTCAGLSLAASCALPPA